MDIAGAYAIPELTSLYRKFEFTPDPAKVVFKDEFKLTGEIESVTERFITRIKPEIEDGKLTVTANDGTSVSMKYEAGVFDASCTPVEVKAHGGSSTYTFYLIDLNVKNPKADMTFEFVIE